MIAVHDRLCGAMLGAAQRASAQLRGRVESEQPLKAAPILMASVSLRWALLVLGAASLLLAGVELLGSSDEVGLVYVVAAPLLVLLAHRRVLPALIGLGVAAHGGSEVYVGNAAGAVGVVAGLAGSVIAMGPPGPSLELGRLLRRLREALEPLQRVQGHPDAAVLRATLAPAVAMADAARPVVLEPPPAPPVSPTADSRLVDDDDTTPELASLPQPAPGAAPEVAPPVFEGTVSLQTLGRLRLTIGGRDATSVFDGYSTTKFFLLYLVVWAALNGSQELSRQALAAEMYHAHDEPLTPLRNIVLAVRQTLPAALIDCYDIRTRSVRFLPERCDWDIARLRRLEALVGPGNRVLAKSTLDAIEQELSAAGGREFLPDFDTLAEDVTQDAGVASDVVRQVRSQLDATRARLALAFAHSYRQMGEPARAIPFLRQELRRNPANDDVRKALVRAYSESGQPDEAQRVDAGLDDEDE